MVPRWHYRLFWASFRASLHWVGTLETRIATLCTPKFEHAQWHPRVFAMGSNLDIESQRPPWAALPGSAIRKAKNIALGMA